MRSIDRLFSVYDSGATDKTSRNLRILYRVFGFATLGFPLGQLLERHYTGGFVSKAGAVLSITAAIAWFMSVILVTLIGANSYGKSKKSNSLIKSVVLVLRKVFIYVLLPSMILTLLAVLFAIATKQPTFR
jgi:hypothetical protein